MGALFDFFLQAAAGLLICTALAFGMSSLGEHYGGVFSAGDSLNSPEDVCSTSPTADVCRQCANSITFKPGEWCAACRQCGQLTNLEQRFGQLTPDPLR